MTDASSLPENATLADGLLPDGIAALRKCAAAIFCAKIGHTHGLVLEDLGFVRWHPGSGYEITEAGRAALQTSQVKP